MEKKTLVFDLDDTLVPEIDFLKSAFAEIALHLDETDANLFDQMFEWYRNKEDVFMNLEKRYERELKEELRHKYRNHYPGFDPLSENREMLLRFKAEGHYLGLITDGYAITQRNKIKALDIEHLFDLVVISEEFGTAKPHEANYLAFHKFGTSQYYYISDNVHKDFITPNKLGWTTVCLLDSGQNIHSQDFDKESIYLPTVKVRSLRELDAIINT
jgi:putative hydrolase of the HAD superfamily